MLSTISVAAGDVSGLVGAINTANSSPEADTIVLAGGIYTVSSVDNYWFGPNGFPAIASDITIIGNYATISRDTSGGTPGFRLFCVLGGPTFGSVSAGSLTLENLTLAGGYAAGGNSGAGGAGLGAGGAIFNFGTLSLTNVCLQYNAAQGGTVNGGGLGFQGAGMGGNTLSNYGGGFGGPFPGALGGDGGVGGTNGAGGGGGFSANGSSGGSGGGNGGGLSGLGGAGGNGYQANGGSGGDGGGGGGGSYAYLAGNFGYGGGNYEQLDGSSSDVVDGDDFGGQTPITGGGGGGGVGGGGAAGGQKGVSKKKTSGGGGGGFGGGGGGGSGGENSNGGQGGFGGGGGPSGKKATPGTSVFGGGAGGSGGGGGGGGGGAGMGGAIFNLYGTVRIVNSTITQNVASGGSASGLGGTPGSAYGGGIFNLNGNVTLLSVTIAGNSVGGGTGGTGSGSWGGGVFSLGFGNTPGGSPATASLSIGNSILAGSTGGADLVIQQNGNATSQIITPAPNMVQNLGTGVPSGLNILIGNPNLGPLQKNGGNTNTMALQTGSPAIGVGSAPFALQVGDPLVICNILDTYSGQAYINLDPFDGGNTPVTMSWLAPASSIGHYITPLVFTVSGGVKTLVAVYQPIYVSAAGAGTAGLQLLQGQLTPGTVCVFGYSDQQVVLNAGTLTNISSNTGTIPYENSPSGGWVYTAGPVDATVPLSVGSTFSESGTANFQLYTGRLYSASLTLSSPAIPYDQRGVGYSRVVNGSIDLGAYQTQNSGSAAPTVLAVTPDGNLPWTRSLTITFSRPIQATSAQDIRNYRLVAPNGRVLPILKASYDSKSQSVKLTLGAFVNLNSHNQLTLFGTGAHRISGANGLALDGQNKGQPGNNFEYDLTRPYVLPRTSFYNFRQWRGPRRIS